MAHNIARVVNIMKVILSMLCQDAAILYESEIENWGGVDN